METAKEKEMNHVAHFVMSLKMKTGKMSPINSTSNSWRMRKESSIRMIQTSHTISCRPTSTLRGKTSWGRNLRNPYSDKKNWSRGRIRSFSSWMGRCPRMRKKAAKSMMMIPRTKKRRKCRMVLIMMISIKKAHRCSKNASTSASYMLSSETPIKWLARTSSLSQTKRQLISLKLRRKLRKPALLRRRALQPKW